MTATTQNRQPAGVPTGGQFAAVDRAAPDVELTGPTGHLSAVFHRSYQQLQALENLPSGGDAKMCAQLRAQALAAAVKDSFPTASTVALEESDQIGSKACWVTSVKDAEGNELTSGYGEVGGYDDDLIDVLYEFQEQPWEIGPDNVHRPATPGVVMEGSEKYGYDYTVDISAALATEPEPPAPEIAATRATALVSHYLAHYGDLAEDDPQGVIVRDMLTDLHHWARVKGVDLDDAFARAGQIAHEELEEAGDR